MRNYTKYKALAQSIVQQSRNRHEKISLMYALRSKINDIIKSYHCKMKLIQRRAYEFRSFENYRL